MPSIGKGFPLKAKEKAEARRGDLRKDKKGAKNNKKKRKRIKDELQATADYIALLEIELGEISIEKDNFKAMELEKKIAREYAYYNGLKYALEIMEN